MYSWKGKVPGGKGSRPKAGVKAVNTRKLKKTGHAMMV